MNINSKEFDKKIEALSAIILALAIICTGWSAYQSTLWSGVMTFTLSEVNADTQKYVMNTIQQSQYSTVDAITFIEYIKAQNNKDDKLSDFYFQRFRDDFKPAVEAWLKTNPFENPDGPPHPFVMSEYKKTFSEDAKKFADNAALKWGDALQANKNSDSYMLLTVIYASVLFIGAILSNFSEIKLRMFLLILSGVIFVIATVGLFSLPLAPSLS
ncbi:MAG: hypothetical protein KGZ37_03340 [Nitrosarchaeum sp.]|nr:hypothetical protein [Nitrosarchaeum sp.]